jgi:hypothetical protein
MIKKRKEYKLPRQGYYNIFSKECQYKKGNPYDCLGFKNHFIAAKQTACPFPSGKKDAGI